MDGSRGIRASGTDGSDHSVRMRLDDRYHKMAAAKTQLGYVRYAGFAVGLAIMVFHAILVRDRAAFRSVIEFLLSYLYLHNCCIHVLFAHPFTTHPFSISCCWLFVACIHSLCSKRMTLARLLCRQ